MHTVTILSIESVSIIIIIGIGLSYFFDPSWISKNLKDFKNKQSKDSDFIILRNNFNEQLNSRSGTDISKIFNICSSSRNTPEDNTSAASCDGNLVFGFSSDFD